MSDIRTMSREFLKDFIQLYQTYPCLWKIKSKDYSDRNLKSEAYKILTEKLKIVQPDANKNHVINKINTLRGGFRREYKKVQNSKKSGDVYVPSLWYYDLLLFVRDQEVPRLSTSNIRSDDDEDDNECEIKTEIIESYKEIDDTSEENSTDILSEWIDGTQQNSIVSNRPTSASSLEIDPCRKRRKTTKYGEILDTASYKLNNSEDEFTIIGKNVATKLRRLPNETRIYSEKLINDVLFQAELDQVDQYTRIRSEVIPFTPPTSS